MEKECKKPPLGITPRFLNEEGRIIETKGGINRFIDAKQPIPIEWIEELNEYFERQAKLDNTYKNSDVACVYMDKNGYLTPF